MKKITTVLGAAALAGVAYKILTHRKADGSTLLDDLVHTGRSWADQVNNYAENQGWKDKVGQFVDNIKDKLMPDLKGPNGESVFTDMYDRNYYTEADGSRVYVES